MLGAFYFRSMKNIFFALVLSFIVVGCGTSNSNPPEQSKESQYPIAGRWQADLNFVLEGVDWEELDMEKPDWRYIYTIEVIDSSTFRVTDSGDSLDLTAVYDNEEHTSGYYCYPTANDTVGFSMLGNDTLRWSDLELIRIE